MIEWIEDRRVLQKKGRADGEREIPHVQGFEGARGWRVEQLEAEEEEERERP